MARDSSGTYDLPLPDVVAGDTIEATWANTTLTDLETEMTDSLSRSGKGGMTAALKIAAGTVSAPGIAFSSETNTGLYRAGAGDVRMSLAGSEFWRITSAGFRLADKDLIIGTGGKGIDFAAQTPTAATGATTTAEIFKHYEVGTWTPNLWDSSNSSSESQAYTAQLGRFVRIGGIVFISGYMGLSDKGMLTTSHAARIGPLPFTSAVSTNCYVNFFDLQNINLSTDCFMLGEIDANQNYILVREFSTATSSSASLALSAIPNGGAGFWFSGFYFV